MESILGPTRQQKTQVSPQYTVTKEVLVDQSFIGLIIGAGGSQIKRLQDQFGVVILIEKASVGGDKRKITVHGKNQKDV
jgi:polyribonucleotide nucleotidyltransferase